MDILKYFHEEPAALYPTAPAPPAPDGLTPLEALLGGARLHRGYLAGTRLPDDPEGAPRVGATALDDPGVWARPLLALFAGLAWTRLTGGGEAEVLSEDAALATLLQPHGTAALAAAAAPVAADRLRAAAEGPRRDAVQAFFAEGGAEALLFPERAHDGFDWSLFSAAPLRERFVAALRAHPAPPDRGPGQARARRFVLPYRRARGEHLFYFERWQLEALPEYVEEV